ncbi:MAG: DNA alkylation repair protein [Bacteroidales bacterium]|nr:DNA alkylation repair protein [Bacteroidales bacterium]
MIENEFKSLLSEVAKKVNSISKNAPSQRKLFKERYSFSNKSTDEQLKIWNYIWNSSSDFWIKIQAFLFCESQMKNKEFLINSWDTIKNWQTQVDNWGHCDGLSKIYTKILELSPSKVLKQLKVWNKSNNQWDKRQSLVSLLYFSRTKKTILDFEIIIQFIDNLLIDKEYYVQKAVGWSLKELYNVYPQETLNYLEKNIKNISSIAFSPAMEKLQKHEKEKLKKIRQDSRV